MKDHKYGQVFVGDVMTGTDDRQHRSILQGIARRAMLERGLLPDFPPQALAELDGINGPAIRTEESTRDLRHLAWCSIDNDDSQDLDQLTVAESMPGGSASILVAIADVDAVVKKQSTLYDDARHNTTSVYTGAKTCRENSRKSRHINTGTGFRRNSIILNSILELTGRATCKFVFRRFLSVVGFQQNFSFVNFYRRRLDLLLAVPFGLAEG